MFTVTGKIFDIQHFSLHDGPGIRSTVFFQGCPLSCLWCSNPESQSFDAQLMFFQNLCTKCGKCVAACPKNAMSLKEECLVIDRDICVSCGSCVEVCPNSARQISGRIMTVDEVCTEVRQHWQIFQQSCGGVTCSGGEPLFQPEFLHRLLKKLHDEIGLHTCLETCGVSSWQAFERLLPYLDMLYLDIKHMDSKIHKTATGSGNEVVLANARNLAKTGIPLVIRVPLIPKFNDHDDNLHALGAFLKKTRLTEAEIMPYHAFGLSKYAALDRTCLFHPQTQPRITEAVDILQTYGVHVLVHQN